MLENLLKKLTYLFKRLKFHARMEAYGLIGLCNGRKNYIRSHWQGVQNEKLEGRVCVFVHFDRQGEVHDFVIYYLKSLRSAGFKIVFVSNAGKLKSTGLQKVQTLAHSVVQRVNIGYDFGAYKDGLFLIPTLDRVDLLLLANDSVYGPFVPIETLLQRIDSTRAQFWGATDSWETSYHIQSYFLLFGRDAIGHSEFLRFWRRVRYVNSKWYVIHKYEIGLSQALIKAGLRGAALVSVRATSQIVIDSHASDAQTNCLPSGQMKESVKFIQEAVRNGTPLNISHFFWESIICEMGYPFIKRELLQKNPMNTPYISSWKQVINSVSDYDTELIAQHLELTLRDRFV